MTFSYKLQYSGKRGPYIARACAAKKYFYSTQNGKPVHPRVTFLHKTRVPIYTPGRGEAPWEQLVFQKKKTKKTPTTSLIHCSCSWSCVLYQPVLSYTVVVHDLVFYISQFSHTLFLFMILCSISASSLIHCSCSWSCVLYQPVLSHTVVVHDLVFYISLFSLTLLLFMILCSISASSLIHCCCSWSSVLYQPVLSYTVVVHDLVFYIS